LLPENKFPSDADIEAVVKRHMKALDKAKYNQLIANKEWQKFFKKTALPQVSLLLWLILGFAFLSQFIFQFRSLSTFRKSGVISITKSSRQCSRSSVLNGWTKLMIM